MQLTSNCCRSRPPSASATQLLDYTQLSAISSRIQSKLSPISIQVCHYEVEPTLASMQYLSPTGHIQRHSILAVIQAFEIPSSEYSIETQPWSLIHVWRFCFCNGFVTEMETDTPYSSRKIRIIIFSLRKVGEILL